MQGVVSPPDTRHPGANNLGSHKRGWKSPPTADQGRKSRLRVFGRKHLSWSDPESTSWLQGIGVLAATMPLRE